LINNGVVGAGICHSRSVGKVFDCREEFERVYTSVGRS
jgi:hypothetical protein